jgi:hypothetical protein
MRGWETPILLSSLERADLNHWSLALFNRSSTVGVSHPLTRGQKRIQFPKLYVLQNAVLWTTSIKPVIPSVIHHHQNPSESGSYAICEVSMSGSVHKTEQMF